MVVVVVVVVVLLQGGRRARRRGVLPFRRRLLLSLCGWVLRAVLRLRLLRSLVCCWGLLHRRQTLLPRSCRLGRRSAVRNRSGGGALALERAPLEQALQPLVPAAAAGPGSGRRQLCLQLPCCKARRPRRRRLSIVFIHLQYNMHLS